MMWDWGAGYEYKSILKGSLRCDENSLIINQLLLIIFQGLKPNYKYLHDNIDYEQNLILLISQYK